MGSHASKQQRREGKKHGAGDGSHKAAGAAVGVIGLILRRRLVAALPRGGAAIGIMLLQACFIKATVIAIGSCRRSWLLRCAAIVACNPQHGQCVYWRKRKQLQQNGDMTQDIPHGNLGGKDSNVLHPMPVIACYWTEGYPQEEKKSPIASCRYFCCSLLPNSKNLPSLLTNQAAADETETTSCRGNSLHPVNGCHCPNARLRLGDWQFTKRIRLRPAARQRRRAYCCWNTRGQHRSQCGLLGRPI